MTSEKLVFGPGPGVVTLYNQNGDIELHSEWKGLQPQRQHVLSTFHTTKQVRALRTANHRLFVLQGDDCVDIVDVYNQQFHWKSHQTLEAQSRIHCLASNPSGTMVVAGLDDGHVTFWSLTQPHPIHHDVPQITSHTVTLSGNTGYIERVAISDDHLAVTVSSRGEVTFWDADRAIKLADAGVAGEILPNRGPAAVVFLEKPLRLMMLDHQGHLWEISTHGTYPVQHVLHDDHAVDIAVSPDGKRALLIYASEVGRLISLDPFIEHKQVDLGSSSIERVRFIDNNTVLVEDTDRGLHHCTLPR